VKVFVWHREISSGFHDIEDRQKNLEGHNWITSHFCAGICVLCEEAEFFETGVYHDIHDRAKNEADEAERAKTKQKKGL